LIAGDRIKHHMNADFSDDDNTHLLGESATRPSELRCATLAALLLVAGIRPPPRRALPSHRIAAHSGAFNCRF
jgi:hypothetical protein